MIDPRAVLRSEAAALVLLSERPTGPLEAAIDLLEAATAQGLIAFTGLGKSGHLAARAASSFTSLGMPAIYLHPVDALHGDLGLLAPSFALVCLSKSGDTEEVVRLALAATPMPMLAITEGGQLSALASVWVPLPVLPEADPDLPAPNVSLAMTSALLDAIGISLSARVPNAIKVFRSSHPGGSLGRMGTA